MRQQATEVSGTATISRQRPASGDDTVSLVDLWVMLHKSRYWVVAGILSGIVGAVGWVLLPSPVYESRATVQIGTIGEKGMIEEPTTLTVRLMDRYGAESDQAGPRDMPLLARVAQASLTKNAPRSPDMLKLVAVASSPEDAKNFLGDVVETLVQDHGQLYEGYLIPLRQQLATLEQEVGSIKTQMGQLSGAADRLIASQPVQASILALEKGRLATQLNQLEHERFNLKRRISDPFSVSTRIVLPPTLPKRPSRPGIVFAAGVGILVGLALGIVVALLRDLYAKVRVAQESAVSTPRSSTEDRY